MRITYNVLSHCLLYKLLGVIGIFFILIALVRFISWIIKHLFLTPLDLKQRYGNDWVVITGGSDGIGLSFAKEFASLNMKVCIIARNENKLIKIKEELLAQFPQTQVKYIAYDFDRKFNKDDLKDLRSKLDELKGDICILLNNVGVITRDILGNLSYNSINSMINVNIISMTMITKILLESMSKRKRSLIIGSGSVVGKDRFPTRQIYGSSKAYMESFMECIEKEYPNIDCTYLNIGGVETNLNRMDSPLKVQSDEFAHHSMSRLGRYKYTTGHIKHEIHTILTANPIIKWYFQRTIKVYNQSTTLNKAG